jgi:hypothetical protein
MSSSHLLLSKVIGSKLISLKKCYIFHAYDQRGKKSIKMICGDKKKFDEVKPGG